MSVDPKVLKKAKNFFDDKQKSKIRIAALFSVLEFSEIESSKFFKEYDSAVINVLTDYFKGRCEKTKKLPNPSKINAAQALQTKEVQDLLKLFALYRKFILANAYPDNAKMFTWKPQLVSFFQSVTASGTFIKIRLEGVRLLVLFLRLTLTSDPEYVELFKAQFNTFVAADRNALLPGMSVTLHDAIEVFEDILANLNGDAIKDYEFKKEPLEYLFELLKSSIMYQLMPNVASHYKLNFTSQVSNIPHEFTAILFTYVCRWIMGSDIQFLNEYQSKLTFSKTKEKEAAVSVSTPITTSTIAEKSNANNNNLKDVFGSSATNLLANNATRPTALGPNPSTQHLSTIICSSNSNIAFLFELIRLTLLLPFSFADTIIVAIGLIKSWTASPLSRPRFMSTEISYMNLELPPVSGNTFFAIPELDVDNSLFNYYLKLFISYMGQIFDGRPSLGLSDQQVVCYKKALRFYRLLSSLEAPASLYIDTWECLMDSLLDIVSTHLLPPNKYAIISSPALAESMSDMLAETVFYVWIKSQTQNKDYWIRLQTHLSSATRWSNVVSQWSRILINLSGKLASVVYKVDLETAIFGERSRKGTPDLISDTVTSPDVESIQTTKSLLVSSFSMLNTREWIEVEDDGKWFDLECLDHYHPQLIQFLWKNLLCVLGNPNRIERPEIHSSSLSTLSIVWEILNEINRNVSSKSEERPELFIFVPWLVEATEMTSIYAEGRYLAYACLCRVISNPMTEPPDDSYYEHFYRVVTKGLLEKDDRIYQSIILHASNIFSLNLTGSLLLVPYFLSSIERAFNSKATRSHDSDLTLKQNAIRLLVSISHLAFHYKDMSLPESDTFGKLSFSDIKDKVLKFYLTNLIERRNEGSSDLDPEITAHLIYAFGMFALEEIGLTVGRGDVTIECFFSVILEQLHSRVLCIITACVGCMCAFLEFKTLERSIYDMALKQLVHALSQHLQNRDSPQEIVCKLLHLLCDWVMKAPGESALKNGHLKSSIFEVLERAILINSDKTFSQIQKKSVMDTFRKKNVVEEEESNSMIKLTAEYVLVHLIHHESFFPPESGPTILSSLAIEQPLSENELFMKEDQSDSRFLIFSLNDSKIVTLIETDDDDSLIIVRDISGKYSWSFKQFYHSLKYGDNQKQKLLGLLSDLYVPADRVVPDNYTLKWETSNYKREPNEIPMWKADSGAEEADMFSEVLDYLSVTYTDCTPKSPFSGADQLDATISSMFETQIKQEQALLQTKRNAPNTSFDFVFPPSKPANSFHNCRLFLHHLDLLSWENIQNVQFSLLQKNSHLFRDIKGLDRVYSREIIKAAVLYVGPGQETEAQIFGNVKGSPLYRDFVSSLGWEIDLESHFGYSGGLDKKIEKAIYYCDSQFEMIFHDSTLLPYDQADPKQIKKKRHIGNDHIHIVWNESGRDYKSNTIRGDFGNVQIVITPLKSGLFAIEIERQSRIPLFGPIISGCLLSLNALGPLVRVTAIQAYRPTFSVMMRTEYTHPYLHRQKDLQRIISRHKSPKNTYDQFLKAIYCHKVEQQQ